MTCIFRFSVSLEPKAAKHIRRKEGHSDKRFSIWKVDDAKCTTQQFELKKCSIEGESHPRVALKCPWTVARLEQQAALERLVYNWPHLATASRQVTIGYNN